MKDQATIQVFLDKLADAAFVIGYNGTEGQYSSQLAKAVNDADRAGVSGSVIRMTYFDGHQRGKEARGVQSQLKRLQAFLDQTNEED